MRCAKKLHWVHVASSQTASLYTFHEKRGQEGMNAAGILPTFEGIAVHDHWLPYFCYDQLKHSLCNAHHLRELIFIHEQEKEEWAKYMYDFLILANKQIEIHLDQGKLPNEILFELEHNYTQAVIK